MKILKAISILTLALIVFGAQQISAQKTIAKRKVPQVMTAKMLFIKKNTDSLIKKMNKHLPKTLNTCTLAKWTMKAPQPAEDPSESTFASIWKTNFDGMQVQINSSVSPGLTGLIISGIKLTLSARTGYNRKRVSSWILARYGQNTRVGSTDFFIEYMTNCWFVFRLNQRNVVIELKWMG